MKKINKISLYLSLSFWKLDIELEYNIFIACRLCRIDSAGDRGLTRNEKRDVDRLLCIRAYMRFLIIKWLKNIYRSNWILKYIYFKRR